LKKKKEVGLWRVFCSALERKAGLKINVARNIVRGQSKRPTAETLQAIANAMECTVQDLLGVKKEKFTPDPLKAMDDSLLVENSDLLAHSLEGILKITKDNKYTFTLQQMLLILGEAYTYSVKKDPPKVDMDFIEWFIKRIIG
jgi:transcriptional regulator with XRE-family HTH domain